MGVRVCARVVLLLSVKVWLSGNGTDHTRTPTAASNLTAGLPEGRPAYGLPRSRPGTAPNLDELPALRMERMRQAKAHACNHERLEKARKAQERAERAKARTTSRCVCARTCA